MRKDGRLIMDATQMEAVTRDAQYLQVIGYPGSGKTLVMAHRVARLIAEGVDPSSIVALTFTNSAHLTLRRGIERVLNEVYSSESPGLPTANKLKESGVTAAEYASAVNVNTFHGFSSSLISEYGHAIGLTAEFSMMDFLDPLHLLYNPLTGHKGSQYTRQLNANDINSKLQLEAFMTKYKTYDFDMALESAARILDSRESVNVSHLLVDEFQDCTTLQWKLVRALLRNNPGVKLVACGDPNQEIFTFQEDHFRNAFARMRKELPKTHVVELLSNYRSSPEIVDTVQSLIKHSETRPHGRIRAVRPDGPEPELIQCLVWDEEERAVVELVRELHDVHHYDYKDISILVRTQSNVTTYTSLLEEADVPSAALFSIRGLGIKKLPSVALTLLKWAHNPKDVYLMQLLYNRMTKFIRPSSMPRLKLKIQGSTLDDSTSLTQDLVELDPRKYGTPFLLKWLPSLRERFVSSQTPQGVAQLAQEAIVRWPLESGLKGNISDVDRRGWLNFVKYLDAVAESIKMDELPIELQAEEGAALSALLRKLFAPEDPDNPDAPNKVAVSTIHSAKSREWPVVILPSTIRGEFSYTMDTPEVALRLQYVAASRAQERLFFLNTGPIIKGTRSSFVPIRKSLPSAPLMSVTEASKLYPLLFVPFRRL